MIRALQERDVDSAAVIWLDGNLTAHDFISARYWTDNFEPVKEQLPLAEVYVYEDGRGVAGFVGLSGEHIEGIFVSGAARSHGIGRQLLDYVKGMKPRLTLNVYRKNESAVRFYRREGFDIRAGGLDEATGEEDYMMVWERKRTV